MKRFLCGGLLAISLSLGWAQEAERNEKATETGEQAEEADKTEELPELPNWEEGELDELESGDYVPGSSLIGRLAREALESDENEVIEMPESIRDLPDDDRAAKKPTEIPDGFLEDYFQQLPQGSLNDPQGLLTEQEFRDRKAFLGYHKNEVGIDFYLYLFDRNQQLPDGLGPEQVMKSQLKAEVPSVVVFYFLGAPEKAKFVFSDRMVGISDDEDRMKIFERAVEEALQKSEAISQLEGFSVELSEGLARLEKTIVAGGGSLVSRSSVMTQSDGVVEAEQEGWWGHLADNEAVFWSVTGGLIFVLAGFLGCLGRWLAMKRKTCIFPDAEGATLLDAPYAAGVGGVLSFSSANAPPSSQKSDLPDYLQRM